MKTSLGEVIGITENMSISDMENRIAKASIEVKKELEKIGVSVLMDSINILQVDYELALTAYQEAVDAVNKIKLSLGIGDVPAKPLADLGKSIKTLEKGIANTILNTYVEI